MPGQGATVPKLRPNIETDEFGYASTHIDAAAVDCNETIENNENIDDTKPARASAPSANRMPKVEKPKRKLHLSLGRLGRSKANQKPEPARLRDVTDIRIVNPTFTSENLHQRNYDAFFESGEPVYSLERRPTPVYEEITANTGFFGKSRSFGLRTKNQNEMMTMTSTASVVEESQKGDRCFSLRLFGLIDYIVDAVVIVRIECFACVECVCRMCRVLSVCVLLTLQQLI